MRLLCFFGSGISRPSNLPMSDEITRRLFEEQWHQDGRLYRPGPGGIKPDGIDVAAHVQEFLSVLDHECARYFAGRKPETRNYEHLFTLCAVIANEEYGDSLDPAASLFVDKMRKKTKRLREVFHRQDTPLGYLANEGQSLINSVVRHSLRCSGLPVGFEPLTALLRDHRTFKHIDFVTLNHDLLLEAALDGGDVAYCDGFTRRDGGALVYQDTAFVDETIRVRLLKPHGSINWFLLGKNTTNGLIERYAKLSPDQDPFFTNDENGRHLTNLSANPVFLTGINKPLYYQRGIFGAQLVWFRRFLEQTDRVVCCGYGWRDQGMNDLLFQWLESSRHNRLVLLHSRASIKREFLQNRYSTWWPCWDDFRKSGRLRVIGKWLCQTSAHEIVKKLSEN